tara:strand:- start:917 stop:1114 length:198 start_codon:yes stop_codon:yes gene_type:complete
MAFFWVVVGEGVFGVRGLKTSKPGFLPENVSHPGLQALSGDGCLFLLDEWFFFGGGVGEGVFGVE